MIFLQIARYASITLTGIALLGAAPCNATDHPRLPWLEVRGNTLVANGEPLVLHGFNLGNWLLLEDFLFGLYGVDAQIREAFADQLGARASTFWRTYETVYFQKEDAEYLQRKGVNFLRVPLNQRRFEDPNCPGVYDPEALEQLDRVINLCAKHGIYVLLDLHAVQGGQSRQIYANSASSLPEFWRYADHRRRATDLWVFLAARYANESAVAGYDLLNEPWTEGQTELLTQWYRDTLSRVRRIDQRHLVWLEGDNYGKRFDGLTPDLLDQDGVLVQFHIYPDLVVPVGKLAGYPGEVDGVFYDRAFLEKHLEAHIEYSRKKPLLLGEIGLYTAEKALTVAQKVGEDLFAIAKANGWSWAIWTYKDHRYMGLVHPRSDTPWRRFLASTAAGKTRTLSAGFIEDHDLTPSTTLNEAADKIGEGLRWQEAYHTMLGARRPFLMLQSKALLAPLGTATDESVRALAESFAFANCEESPPIAGLYLSGRGR
ncbi:MAG: cellulase family glycosylhydrolase [Opitutaceae bacterium]|nr:cellulase family glycosylhydrolase [Opitutaceae bacterium]